MSIAARFRDIVSGRRKDWRASLTRGVLSAAEPVYRAVIKRRNYRFDKGISPAARVAVPVISIGNITTGGTGKSPFVRWLANWFQQVNIRPGLISRGYGTRDGVPNDEALELSALLPGVSHIQNADRVSAARQSIENFECEVLVLDDAFQHRRLHRDLDIVLIDALEPFGFEHLLPRGFLREPLSSLSRAHVIAISRADLVTTHQREVIKQQIQIWNRHALLIEVAHKPQSLLNANGRFEDVSQLRGERVAAFCGIGNPAAFRETLLRCGAEIAEFREFSDHYAYRCEDVAALRDRAATLNVDRVVCTMKDFVKLQTDAMRFDAWSALVVGIDFCAGGEEFESLLRSIVRRAMHNN